MRLNTEPIRIPTKVKDSIFRVTDWIAKGKNGRRLITKVVEVGGTSLGMGNHDDNNDRSGENRLLRALSVSIDDIVAMDIGANVGVWSKELLQTCPSAVSVAIEPGSQSFNELEIFSKSLQGIFPIRAAIAATDGEAQLFGTDRDYQQASLHHDLLPRTTFDDPTREIKSEIVPTRSFESIGREIAELGIVGSGRKVNVLKVDTEGFEYEILSQALNTHNLSTHEFTDLLAVQFEFHMHALAQGQTIDDFAELFGPEYQLFRLAPRCLIPREEFGADLANYFGFSNWVALHTSIAAKVVTEYAT